MLWVMTKTVTMTIIVALVVIVIVVAVVAIVRVTMVRRRRLEARELGPRGTEPHVAVDRGPAVPP